MADPPAVVNVAGPSLKLPDQFDFTRPETWSVWIKRFDRYIPIASLSNKSDKEKNDLLCYTLGEKAEEILLQILPDADTKTFAEVKTAFESYFTPKKNVIFERTLRVRLTIRDQLIRDRIVIGIRDEKTSERLQLKSDLTLDTAITMARQAELQEKQGRMIRNTEPETIDICQVDTKPSRPGERKGKQPSHRQRAKNEDKCGRCGLRRHTGEQKCPAENSKCHRCKRIGHWEKLCWSKTVRRVQKEDDEESSTSSEVNEYFLGRMENNVVDLKEFEISVKIVEFKKTLEFKIDTGADVICLPLHTVPNNLRKKIYHTKGIVRDPKGNKLELVGLINVKFAIKGIQKKCTAYIIRELNACLLGKDMIKSFGLIKRINSIEKIEMKKGMSKQGTLKQKIRNKYPTVFKGLGHFRQELDLQTKENTVPFAQSVPRVVSIPLLKKLKAELNKLTEQNIITAVDFPTDWCSPVLNKNIARPVYPIPKVDVTLARLGKAKIFSRLDAKSGYYQVRLSESSKPLTTFITPFGRYMFNRLPFGINCASDYFAKRFADLFYDLENVVTHVDDVLILAEDDEEHERTLHEVLKRLVHEGITLNSEKCTFGVDRIEFLGHIISQEGIEVLPDRVSAISDFPTPTDIKSLQQFLGSVNFVGKFIPNRSKLLEPLTTLLRDNSLFVWGDAQKKAFKEIKTLLSRAPTLAHFDHTKNIIVQADASSYGIGGVLIQEQNGQREIVAYSSRTLSDPEKRYSQIEKEALGLAIAADKFKEYITGVRVCFETDHKPLIQILQSKPLDEMTPRLQRIRIRLMRYNYVVRWIPGKQLVLADALSRNPRPSSQKEGGDIDIENSRYVRMIVKHMPATDDVMSRLRLEQASDLVCRKLVEYSSNGWPAKDKVPEELRPYHHMAENFSFGEGFLLNNTRLVIPPPLQSEIMSYIHEGHLGINKCRERARQSVWWLGLSKQIIDVVTNCPACIKERTNHKEKFVSEQFPDRPWQKIALDFCKEKEWFMVTTDYYSRFIEIAPLRSMTEREVIQHCKVMFARFGIPEIVRSDNGTQFSTEFLRFAREYGFKLVTSSPKYPQSNGCVEAAVKIAKRLIKKSEDLQRGLFAYRTTPLENGLSPAELMFSRKVRSTLPVLPSLLNKFRSHSEVKLKETALKKKQEIQYNRRHRTKNLGVLRKKERVWISDVRAYGNVVRASETPNSYIIKTEKGELRRNRVHLIPAPVKRENENVKAKTKPDYVIEVETNEGDPLQDDVSVREGEEVDETSRDSAPPGSDSESEYETGESDSNAQNETVPARKSQREKKPPSWFRDYTR
ncbi:PREDICTED: uncharacterized protein K02A2.6-like [Vollenhovia emeryi]|uniref:uncharacterized protein K02A2.6-like n=1 Tax=Vollenhovia emeryi TaxID=411798 RepID=UPI0005F529CD|nr:PREDICTED: uncharacterized protein K02A2.6-like [Vollenhovia emeryi]